MVTEGLPLSCSTCYDYDEFDPTRPPTARSARSSEDDTPPHIAMRKLSLASNQENNPQTASTPRQSSSSHPSSTIETPPESPRLASFSNAHHIRGHRRDSSFRKTYDENDKKRAVPCENCALTVPQNVKEQIPEGAPGSPCKSGPGDNGSPKLRSRVKIGKVLNPPEAADAPKSTPSDSDDSCQGPTAGAQSRRRSRTLQRQATNTSSTSPHSSSQSQAAINKLERSTHEHYCEYISTHDPESPTSFSILRQSCLRTLSCETLPPSSSTPAYPVSPAGASPNPFSHPSSSTPTSTSGGPIFFGDPLAGYTTAFIFRIPDPYARGRRRVYALMALSTRREPAAIKAYTFISNYFKELAAWIQGLAEAEAERQENFASGNGSYGSSGHSSFGNLPLSPTSMTSSPEYAGSGVSSNATSSRNSSDGQGTNVYERGQGSAFGKRRTEKSEYTPTSSFLTGGRFDPDGFPRKNAMSLRSRGLAELVGKNDFFIDLHAKFVALLAHLAALFSN